jgi:replicative DNA helicase
MTVEARTPPHSLETEQALIGSILNDNGLWEAAAAVVGPQHFYAADHAAIWRTCTALVTQHKPADVITVYEAGGHDLPYLNQLAMGSMSGAAAVAAYADVVRGHAERREVLRLVAALVDNVHQGQPSIPLPQVLDGAISSLLALQQRGQGQEPRPMSDLAVAFLDDLEARASGRTLAYSTGLFDLDRLTAGGGRPGELWVIGARPSMGKTAFMLSLCRHVSASHQVLVLTQEDSHLTLTARHVAAAGLVNLADLRNPAAAPDSMWHGVAMAMDEVRALRIDTDDQAGLTLADVRRKIQQTKRKHGELALVVIDYLQLMQGDGDNRNQMLGLIANGLKLAAKQYGCWIVLLSQLSREADKVAGPPQIGHLRDSGDIEGAADLIGMLYRECMRKPKTAENAHLAELHVCKQKNGPTDTLRLWFDGATQRFGNWGDHGPP